MTARRGWLRRRWGADVKGSLSQETRAFRGMSTAKTEAEIAPALSEHATDKERKAYIVCATLAKAFTAKGLTSFYGRDWDGANDHHADAPFWYFHPRGNGGVGIYHEHVDGAYDQHNAEPEDLEGFSTRFAALEMVPPREDVWAAADAAAEAVAANSAAPRT